MDREKLLAAEVYGYSYAHYSDRKGNVRFDRLMPEAIRTIERGIKENWSKRRVAERLRVPENEVDDALAAFQRACQVVDAADPSESFRNGVRQSIELALEEGLGPESMEALVTQICFRAADLAFLLDLRNEPLSRYSGKLRWEPDDLDVEVDGSR